MTKRPTSAYRPLDDAEGGASIEALEPASPTETTTMPVVRMSPVRSPSAETGLIPAVLMDRREGLDTSDSQDAKRTTAESQQAVSMVNRSPESGRSRLPTVLIIEDTTELAEVIQATLERMNIITAHETHGTKGIARFEAFQPDVVLLDIGLPDMSGWKFLETVKEHYRDRMPIIIVITAYGDPANRLVGKLQGVNDYLIKPFTSDEVERVVMAALSSGTA
jgi:CheY-like chemotaxis protein